VQILKVHVMPDKDLHDKMMIGSNRKFTKVPRGKVEREKRDQERTEDQKKERMSKLLKRDDTRRKKISEVGTIPLRLLNELTLPRIFVLGVSWGTGSLK
jgi:hypothetical protein